MLTREQDYAFQSPSLVRKKLRKAELTSGAARLPTRHPGVAVRVKPDERQRDRELQELAERGYRRLVADWQSTPKVGTGATPGRASAQPSKGKAARQAESP